MRPLFLDPTARYDSLICSQYLDGNWSRHCQTAIWFWVGKQKCIIGTYESRAFPLGFCYRKGSINRILLLVDDRSYHAMRSSKEISAAAMSGGLDKKKPFAWQNFNIS